MIDLLVFFLMAGLFAAIPFDRLLFSIYNRLRHTYSQLDIPKSAVKFSKAPFIVGLGWVFNFLKGFLIPLAATQLFGFDEWVVIASVGLTLALHIWSPFLGFTNRTQLFMVFWGIYTFLNPGFIVLFPLAVGLFTFLCDAYHFGLVLSMFSMSLILWMLSPNTFMLPLNIVLIMMGFFAASHRMLYHLEHKPFTLLDAFNTRR